MNPARSIVALLLAFLIGSPLCCCVTRACEAPETTGTPSCCQRSDDAGDGEKAPVEHVCACKTKDARDLSKHAELPDGVAVALPVETAQVIRIPLPAASVPVIERRFFPGSDPPRARLARLSRWLL